MFCIKGPVSNVLPDSCLNKGHIRLPCRSGQFTSPISEVVFSVFLSRQYSVERYVYGAELNRAHRIGDQTGRQTFPLKQQYTFFDVHCYLAGMRNGTFRPQFGRFGICDGVTESTISISFVPLFFRLSY